VLEITDFAERLIGCHAEFDRLPGPRAFEKAFTDGRGQRKRLGLVDPISPRCSERRADAP